MGDWLLKFMKNKSTKTGLKIAGATITAIFSLASVFTGTYAWFAANASATATNMQITIEAPDYIDFDLFYLQSFTDNNSATQDGNYNTTTGIYSGYEIDYTTATFTQVDFENLPDPSPVEIDHLWPAHKLTFAIIITGGAVSEFSLTDWDEGVKEGAVVPKINSSQNVNLSWAINIYGAAYSTAKTNNSANDVASAYASSYHGASLSDVFTYSENNLAPAVKTDIQIVNPLPQSAENYQTIVFFTIEFSNDSSTFYTYNKTTGYYEKNASGNSNCYENLCLNELKFEIK